MVCEGGETNGRLRCTSSLARTRRWGFGLSTSVDLALRELGVREAGSVALGNVDMIEPLEPRVAVDEIEARAALREEVRDDEVDTVVVAADRGIELCVRECKDQFF